MKNKEIYLFLKPFIVKEKKYIVLAITLSFVGSLLGITYGYFSGLAMNSISGDAFKIGIFILILNLFLSILNMAFFERIGTVLSAKLSFRVIENITFALYCKVLKLPTKAFEEKSSGEFINRITNDSETITNAVSELIYVAIKVFTSALVFFYVLGNSLLVAVLIILYIFIILKTSNYFNKRLNAMEKEIRKVNDIYVAGVNESIRGIREVRALGIDKTIHNNLKGIVKNLFKKRSDTIYYENNYYAFNDSLSELFIFVVFVTIVFEIYLGKSSFTFLIAMSYYVYNFQSLVQRFSKFSTQYQKLRVSVERVYEIVNNKLYDDVSYGSYRNQSIAGEITFKDVTFHYHDNKSKILNEFNLHVMANTKVAIIGKSGQGKSTIFNLLLRYFDTVEGKVLLDGVPIEEYDEESLRNNISIIRQEPFLFNKTIVENFKIVNSKITLEEIRKYCKIALLDDYIMSLPKKYQTIIGEGGVNLSGGQKQRLAIARALSKNSKVILFDEATSALDNEAQEKIISVVKKIAKDHTIITIAHRLSTIIDSDVIHIMGDGKIICSGTHEELLRKNKTYQELYRNNV